jgi:hypothetical protein
MSTINQDYFQLVVTATDTPNQGAALSSDANVVVRVYGPRGPSQHMLQVNKITNAHRFIVTAEGILPTQMERYIADVIR